MILNINKLLLILLLFCSVKSDIIERRIPNKFTLPVILWGVIVAGMFSGFDGILFSLGGFLVGLAVFFIPFLMGGVGAGDVKLMAAVGSLMGPKLTVYSALLTAIAGGIIVIGYTVYKGYFIIMIKNIGINLYKKVLYFGYLSTRNEKIMKKYKETIERNSTFEKTYIPYGVAIAIGTLIVLTGNHLGYPPFV